MPAVPCASYSFIHQLGGKVSPRFSRAPFASGISRSRQRAAEKQRERGPGTQRSWALMRSAEDWKNVVVHARNKKLHFYSRQRPRHRAKDILFIGSHYHDRTNRHSRFWFPIYTSNRAPHSRVQRVFHYSSLRY